MHDDMTHIEGAWHEVTHTSLRREVISKGSPHSSPASWIRLDMFAFFAGPLSIMLYKYIQHNHN